MKFSDTHAPDAGNDSYRPIAAGRQPYNAALGGDNQTLTIPVQDEPVDFAVSCRVPMPRPTLRFGIHDGNTHCAATWRLWTESGKGNSEVYLANRSLGGTLKASLHQSGNWHIAFSERAFGDQVAGAIPKFQDRFMEKWPRPNEMAPGFTLAFRIVTPWSSVTGQKEQHRGSKIVWVENAPEGKATEIDVLFTKPSVRAEEWPGKNSLGTSLVGSVGLDNGETVWVVSWVIDMPDFSKLAPGTGHFFAGKSRKDIDSAENLKAIAFGTEPDGSRVMYDVAVQKKR